MEGIDISVVVPVYNAELYVDKCVEGLLCQNFHGRYEILLINDGSRDNTLSCLNKWKGESIIRVITKKNGGVSSARNVGIENAEGRYVVFVDVDDWVDSNYLTNLYGGLKKGTGVVISGYKEEIAGKTLLRKNEDIFYDKLNFRAMFSAHNMCKIGLPWCEIFDLTVIKDKCIRFDSNVHFSEDSLFLLQYLEYCDYVRFIDACDYHYNRVNENSLSIRYNSFENEYHGYLLMKSTLKRIQEKFSLTDEDVRFEYDWIFYLLMRAIKTSYRKGANWRSHPIRIKQISTLSEDDIVFLSDYLLRVRGIDKIICKMISSGNISVLDRFLNFFFKIRYGYWGNKMVKYFVK